MESIHAAKKLFDRNLKRFLCPVCQDAMNVVAGGSVICKKGHSFDFAKQGYLNLFGAGNSRIYGKKLFKARRDVMETGLYFPVVQKIEEVIKSCHNALEGEKGLILDAGCGEGYYLRQLAEKETLNADYGFCGIDISKEGVAFAAKGREEIMWCVADLAKLPIRAQSVDVLLNILTPANYGEFGRVLAKRGIIVKIIPEAGYLREIRERIGIYQESKEYDNTQVISHTQNHMKIIKQCRLTYEEKINIHDFANLVRMTPMTSSLKEEEKEKISENAPSAITVDFTLVVGRQKK